MRNQPVRHATMRERNLAVVLDAVAGNQPVTRARLAELTGFTKTTVSNLLAVLGEAGLVRDGEVLHAGDRGRPGVGVSLDGEGAAALGLEINVDYLAACVLDLRRRVRHRETVVIDNRDQRPETVVGALGALAQRALDACDGLRVAGATVALPGLLDHDQGLVRRAPNLGWRDVPVSDLLREALPSLRFPAACDNEANLAALGELWFGDHDLDDFVYVSGEVGIGAGIVVRGGLFRGAHGYAGELGHVTVRPGGPYCTCGGRGCLELVAGQRALLEAAGLATVAELVAGLAEDARARAAVAEAGEALAAALAPVVNLLDPETIVLGGSFAALAPWIEETVRRSLAEGPGVLQTRAPRVVASGLATGGAAVLGAAGVVIEHIVAAPAVLLSAV